MSIDLLQEIGLNKYEAEAYYTLLTQGPLTGYELGKRSQVPLSRSYDVLERLSQKGLALAQPGDPARYMALDPRLFLG
ncbi:MAG TPA: helix-turn-helix domain-containing protein, partial [Ktedonobacteraceae bacterium]|nr:helix-turn-helix domain-containing protein [Ktedonobacteraceae bacterium]